MRELMSHRQNAMVIDAKKLREEHMKLYNFISNNLLIECGHLKIDIVNNERINIYDSDEED